MLVPMDWYTKGRMKRVLVLVVGAMVLLLPVLAGNFSFEHASRGNTLRVVFFDVGQGDSIFIETPSGKQVLIDGGPDRNVLRRLAGEMGYWDRTIDMVIATHEDKDHVGGLPDVFNRYSVGIFVRTENQGESLEANIIDELSKREGSEIVFARRGMEFDFGASTTLEILFPDRDPTLLESNTSSIVARLVYGESEFLLTGDSPKSVEEYLVSLDREGLQSDVLKLGHHGSRTSTSELLLDAVKPKYAVVSSGKDNRYGHPHEEVTERLLELSIPMFNTAEEGNIIFVTEGKEIVRQ